MAPCANDHAATLLWSYWILATGAALFTFLPGTFAPAFKQAVQLSAARGKLCSQRPDVSLRWLTYWAVPQQWFLHFYIAGTACNSAVLLVVAATPINTYLQVVTLTCLLLLELHLVRRSLETSLMMTYPKDARMHIIAYIFGLSYYIVLPVSCVAQEIYSRKPGQIQHPPPHLITRHYLGIAIFLSGNMLQCWSHSILAQLRSKAERSQREEHFYKIPHGGPFELVSCPHYLGEIVIYFGLALLAAKEMPVVLIILTWVVANLLLAAQPTHVWYKQHFKDYPAKRKALIPFLY